jgi:shikimate kinase
MNIVLIGYRGTGKSAVAEILSNALQMKSIGMDAEIVKRAGISIPEIVEKYGWPRFRDMEAELAREIGTKDNIIIDTGGGVIERPENIEDLRRNGLTFWLKASVGVIVKRIETGTGRPALTKGKSFTEEVTEVLEKRIPKYLSAACYDIDTDNITPDEVAARIVEIWKMADHQKIN